MGTAPQTWPRRNTTDFIHAGCLFLLVGPGLVAATILVAVDRWPGWRGLWCPARLSFQLDILRLITRGLWRARRVSRWRRVRVNEMRSGSVPASSAAWGMRVRMAWWTSRKP